MSHHHHHHDENNLGWAFALNLIFTIIELVGGLLTNSVAIISDAIHDAGDSFSLGLAWILDRYSKREGTERFSYGYRRLSLLGALLNTVVLIIGSVFVLFEAVPRLMAPEAVEAAGMFWLALLGIGVNGLAAWRLRGGKSANTQTVALHLLEDVLGWGAVLVVSIVLLFADIPILDPLLSIGITLYILYSVLRRLGDTVALFLQAVPANISLKQIRSRLTAIDDVLSTHHTHIWSLDGEHHVLTTHLVVPDELPHQRQIQIRQRVMEIIDDLHLEHFTVQLEYECENCTLAENTLKSL
ncbi:MAG: cation diffusion facilitator family transporter [Chloroflexota bacterium]